MSHLQGAASGRLSGNESSGAALVSGDVSRIAGVVERLVRAGANVTVQVQDSQELAAANSVIESVSGPGTCTVLDQMISDFADADEVVAAVADAGNGLDMLLTPRPPADDRRLLDLDEAEWQSVRSHYLKRSVGMARAGARRFVAQGSGGRVVTFSSADTFTGTGSVRASLNAAMLSLTSAMAATLHDHEVTANCVVLAPEQPEQSGTTDALSALVEHLCGDVDVTGRFFYCGGADIGIYAMPMSIEAANVRVRLDGEVGTDDVGGLLRPLVNMGKG